jgi:enediyne biosynthesis protein E4
LRYSITVRRRIAATLLGLCLLSVAADSPLFDFWDASDRWNISAENVFGGLARKDYILETTGNGAAVLDFDNDGDEDLLILNGTRINKPPEAIPSLYRNDRKGVFVDVARDAGLAYQGWAQGVCAGDVDNDGWVDLFVTYYGTNRFYRNNKGKFVDRTVPAGLSAKVNRFGSGCTFLDFNRDGLLDLFVSNYVDLDLAKTPKPGSSAECKWKEIAVMCGPRGLPLALNYLYRQNPDGTFTDVSTAMGIHKPGGRYSLQAVSADFDNDGWPDLYVACDMTPSLLFHNKAGKGFDEIGVAAGVAYNFDGRLQAGMGVAVGDYDRDGQLDIAKTNFSGDLTSLFRNDGGNFFTDVSREAGLGSNQLLGWGIALTDFDDDGWLDLMSVNGHVYPEVEGANVGDKYRQEVLLYRGGASGKFLDASRVSGTGLTTPRASRGLALGDLDGDGRPEAVIVNMNEKPAVLQNRAVPRGAFVNLLFEGTGKSNRSAIGARWTVTTPGTTKSWTGEVMSGSSFYSQHSFVQHVGLGPGVQKVDVEVRWPSGRVQKFAGLPVKSEVQRLQEIVP